MKEKHFIEQGMRKLELDNYLIKELDRAGFTKSEIVKTPLVTRIVVNVTRPGLAIGKSGSNITQLTETIAKRFKIDNPQLEIREIEHPEIDAQAVANKMKALIERGFSWRSVVFRTVNDIQAGGAQGLEIVLSGKIAGKAGRKRKQRISYGYMKKVGEQAKLVDYAKAAAYPKVGAIGIKVKIVRPDTAFPDKAKIGDYIKKKEEVVVEEEITEEVKAEEKTAEETGAKKEKVEKKGEKAPQKEAKTGEKPKAAVKKAKKEETKEKKPEVKKEKKTEGKANEVSQVHSSKSENGQSGPPVATEGNPTGENEE